MSYTFLQLQDECLNYGFNATDYRSRMKLWLNEGQRRVARDLDLPAKETVTSLTIVAGTVTYSLPVDFQRITYVFDDTTNSQDRLEPINKWEYEERDPTVRAQPQEYAVDALSGTGWQITFWPTPDAVYLIKVRYVQIPAAMVNDGDPVGLSVITSIQFDYEDLLISYALYRAYGAEDDKDQSLYHYQIYKEGIGACKSDMLNMTSDSPQKVRGTWGSW